MSPWLVLGALVLLAAVVFGVLYRPRHVTPVTTTVAVAPTAVPGADPRVVDPANPPWYANFAPKTPGKVMLCTCHGRPLEVGERVLIWPIPDHPDGAHDLFCRETYEVQD